MKNENENELAAVDQSSYFTLSANKSRHISWRSGVQLNRKRVVKCVRLSSHSFIAFPAFFSLSSQPPTAAAAVGRTSYNVIIKHCQADRQTGYRDDGCLADIIQAVIDTVISRPRLLQQGWNRVRIWWECGGVEGVWMTGRSTYRLDHNRCYIGVGKD